MIPLWAEQPSDIHFHGGIEPSGLKAYRGDTIEFSGWANAYQDWKSGLIEIPNATFDINIIGPDNKSVFKKSLVGDEKSNIRFTVPITDDTKTGKYLIKFSISKEGYETYSEDQRYFWVVGTTDDTIPAQGYDFKIWTKQSQILFGSFAYVYGSICPQLPSSIANEDFIDPETSTLVYQNTVLANFVLTKPDGSVKVVPDLAELINCKETEVGNEIPVFDMSGNWTVHAIARWIDNGTIYQIQSQPINISVKQTLWHSDDITPINLGHDDWINIIPMDWSSDGKYVLFKYVLERKEQEPYVQHLALMEPDGINIKELNIPLLFDNELLIGNALFSADNQEVYFLAHNDLYLYDLTNNTFSKITEGKIISFFDVTSDGSIAYFEEKLDKQTNQYYYPVILADSNAENGVEILRGQDFYAFDLNPNGKKLLYKKTIDSGYGWADRVLTVYDLVTKQYQQVPKIEDADCGSTPKWTPNGELIIYHVAGCGRGWPGGMLGITDMNGNSELLIPSTDRNNPEYFITSPDGKFLLYSYSNYDGLPADFYRMTLAQPVPEFPTTGLILIVAVIMILIVTASKWNQIKTKW